MSQNDRTTNPPADFEPDSRSLQANERTMLAWLRTGVSLIAFGFVIAKFGLWLRASGQPDPQLPHANLMGGVMVLLGAAVEAVGIWRYLRTQNALIHGTLIRHSPTAVVSIAIGVALVGFLLATFILVRTNP